MNAQTYVFSDSMLRLGGISPDPVQAWKDQIKWYLATRNLKELGRINGEPVKFEWKKFPEFTTLVANLAEIQKMMAELMCEPEQFQSMKDHLHVHVQSQYMGNSWK